MKIQSNDLSWKQKGMSYRARLLARLGFITACVSLLCPGLPFLYILPTPSRKTGIFWDDTFPIIYTFGILGIAIFAIIKLRSAWNAPVNFMPSYASIPPDTLGKPFEVWYQETGLSSPFGKGTLDFQEQELVLEGNLFGGSLYSLLSPWKGAKVSAKTPYSNIASVSVEERYIALKARNELTFMSAKVVLYVSEMDNERMYKELKHHFPTFPESK